MRTRNALSLVALAIVASGCASTRRPNDRSFRVLEPLIDATGVSGMEGPVRDTVRTLLPSWTDPEVDDAGNLLVRVGSGSPTKLFIAHLDEIGYAVKDIDEHGMLTLVRKGGFFDSLYEGQPVLVFRRDRGPVSGVVAPRPGYRAASTAAPKLDELCVDIGATSKRDAELAVSPGDTVTIRKDLQRLVGDRATARSFDDRVGCAALLLGLEQLDRHKVKGTVVFAFSTGEEVGLDGAKALSKRLQPNVVFAVDTFVSADSPRESDRFALAPIGEGAVVRALDHSNAAPKWAVAKVLDIAAQHRIPMQYGVTGGGNDGSVFTRFGAIDVPLAWPLRYSHSPAEVIDLRDVDALGRLVAALAEDF
ncbi:MAG: M20/M25/M40 family metallo-hydrolase [Planctomycetes bacterium]|nr:M20/M25/M40 family metallo-hydrolase [Planctomycetota bacterium]MBI3846007.1 M20/M25/M40 family metallo-hydrolase [Planctomycetota bacterium]